MNESTAMIIAHYSMDKNVRAEKNFIKTDNDSGVAIVKAN